MIDIEKLCTALTRHRFRYDFGALFRSYDKMEVIGNIHDNPELLEVSEDGKRTVFD